MSQGTLTVLVLVLLLLLVVIVGVALTVLFRRAASGSDGGAWTPLTVSSLNEYEQKLNGVSQSLSSLREHLEASHQHQAETVANMHDTIDRRLLGVAAQSGQDSKNMQLLLGQRIEQLEEKMAALATTQQAGIEKLSQTNAAELERIRHSVDEQLQSTLQKSLGDSFKQVSGRLEQVQRGLGEMQSLATDVGGLKRVLSNVKNRGTWGELQLETQLEDLLAPNQYQKDVVVDPVRSERVEFAVVLPGKGISSVLLPIDSKFPQQPYENLLQAEDEGDQDAVKAAAKELANAVKVQAKTIQQKYIRPPHSTDFAIMYLPTESLFAEVVRLPGLASSIQSDHKVLITGPTTLMSLLNSLQMGFKTLAIEQRTSEVWDVLAAAKAELTKYGQVWHRLAKQLQTAQNTVEEAGRRTRAVEKQLRDVESWSAHDGVAAPNQAEKDVNSSSEDGHE